MVRTTEPFSADSNILDVFPNAANVQPFRNAVLLSDTKTYGRLSAADDVLDENDEPVAIKHPPFFTVIAVSSDSIDTLSAKISVPDFTVMDDSVKFIPSESSAA